MIALHWKALDLETDYQIWGIWNGTEWDYSCGIWEAFEWRKHLYDHERNG
jgi:hypothetical protein